MKSELKLRRSIRVVVNRIIDLGVPGYCGAACAGRARFGVKVSSGSIGRGADCAAGRPIGLVKKIGRLIGSNTLCARTGCRCGHVAAEWAAVVVNLVDHCAAARPPFDGWNDIARIPRQRERRKESELQNDAVDYVWFKQPVFPPNSCGANL